MSTHADGSRPRRVRPSADALHQSLAGEAVLLNARTDEFFALDPVGTRIWELIVSDGDLDRILAKLAAEYDAPAERIAADVLSVIERLRALGLVEAI